MLASHGHGEPPPYALDLLALDPDGVHRLFADLGFPHYRDQLQDHGISGDVLIHLDHAALKDVGVHSVGQRLAILKAVYDLKVAQDIPIEDGHYVPPSEDLDGAGPLPAYQILGLLSERDERIHRLESEVHSLHSALLNLREDSLSVARGGGAGPSSKPRPSVRSPTGLGFVHPLSNSSTLARSSSTPSRPRNPPPVGPLGSSSLALPQHAGLPDSPHSPVVDSPRTMGDYQQQQQQQHGQHGQQYQAVNGHAHHDGSTATASASAPPPHLQPAEISISGVATPTTPTAPMLIHPDSSHHGGGGGGGGGTPNSHLHPASSSASSRPDHPSPTTATTSSSLSPSASTSRTREGSSTSASAADNPYRSFRVTVEDPCYKVLPAALKKYKINDDWRLYALFICYGNTERCLAYDEKPLLLFQKLKESNDNPVFMLRHIKDIKSPIAVATAKHAARKDKRPPGIGGGVERSLVGVNRDGSAAPASGTSTTTTTPAANGLQGNARPTRLHHPPVLLPVGKDKDKDKDKGAGAAGDEAGEGEGGTDKKDEGGATAGKKAQGYCIAIYPYLAEREDEFDVAVGDTFVILSKTKGWWVVHRDQASPSTSSSSAQLSSSTSSNPDHTAAPRKSAWVPAGCLLETSVPPLSLFGAAASSAAAEGGAGSPSAAAKTPTSATSTFPSSSSASTSTSTSAPASAAAAAAAGVPAHEGNAALVPIPPALVVSVSTPGVALMDYVPRGAGELEVRKGATLRILKRYNHWSYAVKDDGGRGWLPSWFCGRVAKADATAAAAGGAAGAGAGAGAATTPSTPVAPESGHAPPSAGGASSSSAPATSGTAVAGTAPSPRPATAPGGAPKPPLSVNVPPLLPGASGGARSAGAAMMLEPSAEEPSAGAGASGSSGAAGGTGATASKEGQD